MNFGLLKLKDDLSIYFYFLDQEDENYLYLWDLLIPNAIGCVVVCDYNDSDSFKKNVEINNLDKIKLNSNDFLFHAGTSKNDNKILATGGSVLNLVSLSDDFSSSKKKIITAKTIREKIENFWVAPLCKRAERKAMLKSALLTDNYSSKIN